MLEFQGRPEINFVDEIHKYQRYYNDTWIQIEKLLKERIYNYKLLLTI